MTKFNYLIQYGVNIAGQTTEVSVIEKTVQTQLTKDVANGFVQALDLKKGDGKIYKLLGWTLLPASAPAPAQPSKTSQNT